MNDFFDNRRILEIVWKRRIHFIIVGIIAVVLAAIFSSPIFITPMFKSSSRLYPINLDVMSEESETEQLLEIINSVDIKLKMFDAFQLDRVYKVSKDDPLYLTYMLGIYNKNVKARKTEFETVEIEILDEDPVRAKNMCDSLIHFYNVKVGEMHSAKNWEMVKILDDNLVLRRKERDSVMSILTDYRVNYQILDYQLQVPEITRGYMKALSEGRENTSGMREIKRIYDNMMAKGAETYILENRFTHLLYTIDSLKFLYDINLSEAQKAITYSHVVENPLVPDKKAYPVRWLIVAFSLFSSLFIALLVFMAIDFKK
jgi:capsular polysaccharide biosynthesis protein